MAHIAHEHTDIPHQPNRGKVQNEIVAFREAHRLVQGLHHLVRATRAGQLSQRVIIGQPLGVDHRGRAWQLGRQVMVIGDDDIHALCPQIGHLIRGGDARVARDDQMSALDDDISQPIQMYSVRLAATGDMVFDVASQIAEGLDQDGRRRLPIHIKVAPDPDALATLQSTLQALHAGHQVRQLCTRRGTIRVRIKIGPGILGSRDASAGQQLGH